MGHASHLRRLPALSRNAFIISNFVGLHVTLRRHSVVKMKGLHPRSSVRWRASGILSSIRTRTSSARGEVKLRMFLFPFF